MAGENSVLEDSNPEVEISILNNNMEAQGAQCFVETVNLSLLMGDQVEETPVGQQMDGSTDVGRQEWWSYL